MRDEVTFPSGGETCAAYLYRASVPEAPCVVMAHGFAGTRDDGLPAFAERFAAAGLHALVFDYRGFGASTGEPRQVIDIGRQQDDYRAAIAFARSVDGIEGIVLWGTSFSGGHVFDLAVSEPETLAAIAQAPFADGVATLRANSLRNMAIGAVAGVADTALGLLRLPPLKLPAVGAPGSIAAMTEPTAEPGYRAIVPAGSRWDNAFAARLMLHIGTWRPGATASRIACPLLVCVADEDATTPPGPAVRAAERAPRGELARYGCAHFDVYRGEWFERVVADQLEFLARHAGAAREVSAATMREAS
jgi:pimeloyl-ACP methyl ester carboxylesterase